MIKAGRYYVSERRTSYADRGTHTIVSTLSNNGLFLKPQEWKDFETWTKLIKVRRYYINPENAVYVDREEHLFVFGQRSASLTLRLDEEEWAEFERQMSRWVTK